MNRSQLRATVGTAAAVVGAVCTALLPQAELLPPKYEAAAVLLSVLATAAGAVTAALNQSLDGRHVSVPLGVARERGLDSYVPPFVSTRERGYPLASVALAACVLLASAGQTACGPEDLAANQARARRVASALDKLAKGAELAERLDLDSDAASAVLQSFRDLDAGFKPFNEAFQSLTAVDSAAKDRLRALFDPSLAALTKFEQSATFARLPERARRYVGDALAVLRRVAERVDSFLRSKVSAGEPLRERDVLELERLADLAA
jgi:hypothetical protein